ncbi:MAG: carboxypeptidase regulatory-like domain-containing protein, partial [Bacteroidetes bacterium]|nr:carboxypeptidase regulatory-like domain-containing protein [Bacteroidota bacterium]
MKKAIFAVVAILLLSGSLKSQNHQNGNGQNKGPQGPPIGIVTGIILDAETSKPIEYANVVLYKSKDSTLVTGGVTNTKGVFNIDKVPFGGYYLKVNFIGYAPQLVPGVKVTPKVPEVNVGKINFQPGSTNLSEVTITSEKKLVEYTLDKKVVNVEKNIATTGGTAVDVMKNVPSVTVDVDGNVSLRGNGNITILIDGRPSALSGASRSAVLEQIPASSIESIEIITNPSARYQAEGMTGIINIKLKKKMSKGFNGIISTNFGTGDKYNGSINLNYNLGKVNFFASYDGSSRRMKGWGESVRENTLNDSTTKYNQNSDMLRSRMGSGIKFGADFSINSKNLLTVSFGYENRDAGSTESVESSAFDLNNNLLYYNIKNSVEDEKETSQDFSL